MLWPHQSPLRAAPALTPTTSLTLSLPNPPLPLLTLLHLPTLRNPHIQHGPLARPAPTGPRRPRILHHPHHTNTLAAVFFFAQDLTEDDVFVVEPGRCRTGYEELGAVCVWPGVGHGEEVRATRC